jgi:hypothetical protein
VDGETHKMITGNYCGDPAMKDQLKKLQISPAPDLYYREEWARGGWFRGFANSKWLPYAEASRAVQEYNKECEEKGEEEKMITGSFYSKKMFNNFN